MWLGQKSNNHEKMQIDETEAGREGWNEGRNEGTRGKKKAKLFFFSFGLHSRGALPGRLLWFLSLGFPTGQ